MAEVIRTPDISGTVVGEVSAGAVAADVLRSSMTTSSDVVQSSSVPIVNKPKVWRKALQADGSASTCASTVPSAFSRDQSLMNRSSAANTPGPLPRTETIEPPVTIFGDEEWLPVRESKLRQSDTSMQPVTDASAIQMPESECHEGSRDSCSRASISSDATAMNKRDEILAHIADPSRGGALDSTHHLKASANCTTVGEVDPGRKISCESTDISAAAAVRLGSGCSNVSCNSVGCELGQLIGSLSDGGGDTRIVGVLRQMLAERDLYKAAFGAAKEELKELEGRAEKLAHALQETEHQLLLERMRLQCEQQQSAVKGEVVTQKNSMYAKDRTDYVRGSIRRLVEESGDTVDRPERNAASPECTRVSLQKGGCQNSVVFTKTSVLALEKLTTVGAYGDAGSKQDDVSQGVEGSSKDANTNCGRGAFGESYMWLKQLQATVEDGGYPPPEVLLRGIEEQQQLLRCAEALHEEREQYVGAVASLHSQLRAVREGLLLHMRAHKTEAADLNLEADEASRVADAWLFSYLSRVRPWKYFGHGALLHIHEINTAALARNWATANNCTDYMSFAERNHQYRKDGVECSPSAPDEHSVSAAGNAIEMSTDASILIVGDETSDGGDTEWAKAGGVRGQSGGPTNAMFENGLPGLNRQQAIRQLRTTDVTSADENTRFLWFVEL